MPGKRNPMVIRRIKTIDTAKREASTSQEVCPTCNCLIGEFYVIKDGVAYCCERCAIDSNCKCEGCVKVSGREKYKQGMDY